jgi:hypothetical protein
VRHPCDARFAAAAHAGELLPTALRPTGSAAAAYRRRTRTASRRPCRVLRQAGRRQADELEVRGRELPRRNHSNRRSVVFYVMQWALRIGVPLLIIATLACDSIVKHEEFTLSVDNRTDARICHYHYHADAAERRCLNDVDPQSERGVVSDCGDSSDAEKTPIRVILTAGPDGPTIFERIEACEAWQDLDKPLVIEQDGGQFRVSDPFR